MSRSYRKTPIAGITTAKSNAEWKAKAARKLRRRVRQTVNTRGDAEGFAGKRWDIVDPWDAPKDGKRWLRKPSARVMRK